MTHEMKKRIIDIIKENEVTPLPRWYFVVKQVLMWVGITLSCIVASFLVALLIFQIGNFGMLPPHQAPIFVLITLAASVIFFTLATYQIKQTKNAYRREAWKYLTGLLVLSFILGVLFFSIRLHEQVEKHFPRSAQLIGGVTTIQKFWTNPSEGLLAGQVSSYEPGSDEFTLKVFDDREYLVSLKELNDRDLRVLEEYNEVRIVGYQESDNLFHACSIAPWKLRGGPERPQIHRLWQPPKSTRGDNKERVKLNPRETFLKSFETKREMLRSNKCQ